MSEKDTINHREALQNIGMYTLYGDVDEDTCKPAIEWLLYENHIARPRRKELIMLICSSGGDVEDAFALIDVMMSSSIPIKTIGLGEVSSAGLMIFLAGTRGRRVLTPNTSVLSHQFSWSTQGKAHELFASIKEFQQAHGRMIQHYQRCLDMEAEDIEQILLPPQDVWLTAQAALDLGICDHISGVTRD